jgi:transposase
LRIFRNQGLDVLCTLRYKGDPGRLSAPQVERLKKEISTGRFGISDQIRLWIEETFRVQYTPSGIKDLLRRVSASYHKVTGFLWKADPEKQQQFVKKYRRQRRVARQSWSRRTRFYFVDACHPIWGLDLVFTAGCWWDSACSWGWAAAASA